MIWFDIFAHKPNTETGNQKVLFYYQDNASLDKEQLYTKVTTTKRNDATVVISNPNTQQTRN